MRTYGMRRSIKSNRDVATNIPSANNSITRSLCGTIGEVMFLSQLSHKFTRETTGTSTRRTREIGKSKRFNAPAHHSLNALSFGSVNEMATKKFAVFEARCVEVSN